jgi:hypothetical protein
MSSPSDFKARVEYNKKEGKFGIQNLWRKVKKAS